MRKTNNKTSFHIEYAAMIKIAQCYRIENSNLFLFSFLLLRNVNFIRSKITCNVSITWILFYCITNSYHFRYCLLNEIQEYYYIIAFWYDFLKLWECDVTGSVHQNQLKRFNRLPNVLYFTRLYVVLSHTLSPIHSISSEFFVVHTHFENRRYTQPIVVQTVQSVQCSVCTLMLYTHILQVCYYCYYFILLCLSLYRSGNSSICIDSVCSCSYILERERERAEKPAHAIRWSEPTKTHFFLSMFVHWWAGWVDSCTYAHWTVCIAHWNLC